MTNQKIVIACAVTAVVASGGGFWGGTMYQRSKSLPNFQNRGQGRTVMQGQNAAAGMARPNTSGQPEVGMRGGAVMGEVTAKDDKSLTVKLPDGSSKIVVLADSTIYRLSSETKIEQIAVGTTIAVMGTANSDGSTTATSVEINPVRRELNFSAQ